MSNPTYGGQAVLEGVMMRGPNRIAVAVRNPAGNIVLQTEPLKPSSARKKLGKLPLLRGVFALWDALALGMRALVFSADIAMQEENSEASSTTPGKEAPAPEPMLQRGMMWGSMAFSLGVAVALFFVTPVLIMGLIDPYLSSSVLSNLIEKIIRLALILGYIGGVGLMPDIRRVYMYHGAEHKTINAHEAGVPLVPARVREFTVVHPRCGTTFLVVVVLVSFVIFALLGQPPLLLRVLSRIVLIPIVAGVAFELVQLAARNYHRHFVRTLMAPGLAVQALTTREPDDSQLEVAIASLKAVLEPSKQVEESPIAA